MADDLKWLKDNDAESYDALLKAEKEQRDELADLEFMKMEEAAKQDAAFDYFAKTGLAPEEEEGGSYWEVAKAIPEVISRTVKGQEHQLKPIRKAAAKEDVTFLDPMGALSKIIPFAMELAGKEAPPSDEFVVDDPRANYDKRYGNQRPIITADNTVDIDQIYASSLPRERQNKIAVGVISNRYGIPVDKLEKYVKTSLGELPRDPEKDGLETFYILKHIGRLADDALVNAPTGGIERIAKKLDPEVQKALVKPKGKKFLSDKLMNTEVKPFLKAIREGKIDKLNLNGLYVDVDETDTLESIDQKAYRARALEGLGLLRDNVLESRYSILSMFIPGVQLLKGAGALAKAANVASKASKVGKVNKVVRGVKAAAGAVQDVIPTRSLTYVTRNIPGLKWTPHSKVFQAGDFMVTTVGTQMGLAAIAAPEGSAEERAYLAGILSAPPMALVAVPGRVLETIRANKLLETNKDLLRSVVRADNFRDMPRIHQKLMSRAYGTEAGPVFDQWKKFGQEYPGELKDAIAKARSKTTNKKPVFYHGAAEKIPNLQENYSRKKGEHYFGDGFYTSDNFTTASNYTEKNLDLHPDNASPTVYRVAEKTPVKFLDLSKTPPAEVLDVFSKWVSEENVAKLGVDERAELNNLLEVYRQGELSFSDTFKSMENKTREKIIADLKRLGYGGIQTIEEGFGDSTSHNVQVYWEPSKQISLEEVKSKVGPNAPDETAIATGQGARIATPEMFMNSVDDPAVRGIIDNYLRDVGFEYTPAGLERLKHLTVISNSIADNHRDAVQMMKANPKNAQVMDDRFRTAAIKTKELQAELASNPNLVNDEAKFFETVEKHNDGIIGALKQRLAPETYRAAYQNYMRHLVEAGMFEKFSLKQFVDLNRAKAIDTNNPISVAIVKLYDQELDATMQGKVAIQPKGTFDLLMAEPEKSLPMLYDLIGSSKQELLKAKQLPENYKAATKRYQHIQGRLKQEVRTLNVEMNKLGRIVKTNASQLVKASEDVMRQMDTIEKTMSPAVFDTPSYQSIRTLIASSIQRGHIAPKTIDILNDHLSKIDNVQAGAAVKQLVDAFNGYNKKKKAARHYEVSYQNAVADFFELDDAVKKTGESVDPKFQDVLAGLRGQNSYQAYGAIQKLLSDKHPEIAAMLEQLPAVNKYILDTAEYISKGEKIPAELRANFRSLVMSDSAMKKMAEGVEKIRGDARALAEVRKVANQIGAIMDTAEEIVVDSVLEMANLRTLVEQRKKNHATIARVTRSLKGKINYPAIMKEIKEIEEKLYPLFDKVLDGYDLTKEERKLFYKMLHGPTLQHIEMNYHPYFVTTPGERAEQMFQAMMHNSGEMMQKFADSYEEAFSMPLNRSTFLSQMVNANNSYILSPEFSYIVAAAKQRRDVGTMFRPVQNQDLALDIISDRTGRNVETSVQMLPHWDSKAITESTLFMVDNLSKPLNRMKVGKAAFLSLHGQPHFDRIFRKAFGTDGLYDVLYEGDINGNVTKTKYGELIELWKVKSPGKTLDEVMDSAYPGWRKNPEYNAMHGHALSYWADDIMLKTPTPDEWAVALKAVEFLRKYEAKKVSKHNEIIREMNAFNGTAYPEFEFLPYRIMTGIKKDARPPGRLTDSTSTQSILETTFGRHIASGREGQLAKLTGVTVDTMLDPLLIVQNDTMNMFSNAYTQYDKRMVELVAGSISDQGFKADAQHVMSLLEQPGSDFSIAQASLTRKLTDGVYETPGVGYMTQIVSPWISLGPILSRVPTAPIINILQAAGVAGSNPKNIDISIKMLGSLPYRTLKTTASILVPPTFYLFNKGEKMAGGAAKAAVAPTNKLFLGVNPKADWSALDMPSDMNILQRGYKNIVTKAGLGSVKGRQLVQKLEDLDIDASTMSMAQTMRNMPRIKTGGGWLLEDFAGGLGGKVLRGVGGKRWVLRASSSAADWLNSAIARRSKEYFERNLSKDAYLSGLNIYENAIIKASRGDKLGDILDTLIGPLEGLESETTFMKIAQDMQRAAAEGDVDKLYGRIGADYLVKFRNHVITRFDSGNYPTMLRKIVALNSKAGQFANAMTNNGYRVLKVLRRMGVEDNAVMPTYFYLMSVFAQTYMWNEIEARTGLEAERFGPVPQLQTVASLMSSRGEPSFSTLANRMIDARSDKYGMEFSIFKNGIADVTLALLNNDDSIAGQAKVEAAIAKSIAGVGKLTHYGVLADLVNSPLGLGAVMVMDTLPLMEHSAYSAAITSGQSLRFMSAIAKEMYSREYLTTEQYNKLADQDEFIDMLQMNGLSPTLDYMVKLQRLTQERQKAMDAASKEFGGDLDLFYDQVWQQVGAALSRKNQQQRNMLYREED